MKDQEKKYKNENSFDPFSKNSTESSETLEEDFVDDKKVTKSQESISEDSGKDGENKTQNQDNIEKVGSTKDDKQIEIKLEMMDFPSKEEKKAKAIKFFIILLIFAILCLAIYLPLQLSGTLHKIDSAEKLQQVILSGGAYSYLIFFAFQFLQTTILPIPAVVTTVAGTLVFGPWITFAISLLAVLSGSLFAYFLGKKLGRKLIIWVIGKKSALKWEEKLSKGKYVYFLMMLFPFFPDDILCIVAGAINLNFRFFLISNLIARPIVIASTCFFGSGQIIPFHSWGIIVWIILIIIGIIMFYMSWRYSKQIENFVERLGQKLSNFFSRKRDKNSIEKTILENKKRSENEKENDKNKKGENDKNKTIDNLSSKDDKKTKE